MKKLLLLKRASIALFSFVLVTACSSDDGGSGHLDGVPTGEIVPVAERQKALTGFEDGASPRNTDSQKWWKYLQGHVKESCYGETETEDIEESGFYYAFFPNGKMYAKYGLEGEPSVHHDWEWTDSSKSKILITTNFGGTAIFEVTELNDNGVVIASYQEGGDCSALTWGKYGQPAFD